ncbi:MAG: secondary thiamine-phosphate synthase enzyme YjbQ [Nitrososphaeria archaeon]|jgi:conserved hypothetical protein TIGR00149
MIKNIYFEVETKKRRELIDITEKLKDIILKENGSGCINIFVPHTTAGILINENERGLKNDILSMFEKVVPENEKYEHNLIDNNADAHILSVIVKNNSCIPFSDGKLLLGTWQSVFFVELDGPRHRNVIATLIK